MGITIYQVRLSNVGMPTIRNGTLQVSRDFSTRKDAELTERLFEGALEVLKSVHHLDSCIGTTIVTETFP